MNRYAMRGVWLSLAGLAGVGLLAQDARAYDANQHVLVADKALQLYDPFQGTEAWSYRVPIYAGAADEDSIDHVYGYWDPFGQGVTRTHFWDADNGVLDQVTLAGLLGSNENAFRKVTGVGPFGSGVGLWQQAVAYYQLGDKVTAYERLGHICHLIADMSVPAHTHEDAHNPDHYEYTMNQYMALTLPLLDKEQMKQGPLPIPQAIPAEVQWLGDMFPLFYLMYTTNQRADFFASAPPGDPLAGYAGDAVTYTPWLDYTTWETQMAYYMDPAHVDTNLFYCGTCGALGSTGGTAWACTGCGIWMTEVDPSIIIATRYTLVHGVRATAGLLDYWNQTVVPEPATMVLLAAGTLALMRLRRVARRG